MIPKTVFRQKPAHDECTKQAYIPLYSLLKLPSDTKKCTYQLSIYTSIIRSKALIPWYYHICILFSFFCNLANYHDTVCQLRQKHHDVILAVTSEFKYQTRHSISAEDPGSISSHWHSLSRKHTIFHMKQSIYLLLHKSMIMTDHHNRTASLNFFQNHLFDASFASVSKPFVGSSSSKRSGLDKIACANTAFCFKPSDNFANLMFFRSVNPIL